MSDLIYRQDAIDIICKANCPKEDIEQCSKEPTVCSEIGALQNLPSAEPEIILCADCIHWTRTCGDDWWSLGDCNFFEKKLVMCKGFCAWAERRTDEQSD